MGNKMRLTNRKTTTLTLTLLLLCVAAVGVAFASGEQAQKTEQTYGIPENALQYNRTDTTPSGQIGQVRAMENYAFNYRNLTLTLNCTRNCELNVTMDPSLKPKILSLSIEPSQNMSLIMNLTGAPVEAEMVRTRTLNFYLGLEANATAELQAQIRLHINQTELAQELNREVNASRLTWQYYNTTIHEWVTVPSWTNQNNYLVCNTTHFSTWTVAEVLDQTNPQPETSPTVSPTQTPVASSSASPTAAASPAENSTPTSDPTRQKGLPAEYLYLGVAGALAALVAAGFFALKKRKP